MIIGAHTALMPDAARAVKAPATLLSMAARVLPASFSESMMMR